MKGQEPTPLERGMVATPTLGVKLAQEIFHLEETKVAKRGETQESKPQLLPLESKGKEAGPTNLRQKLSLLSRVTLKGAEELNHHPLRAARE